MSTEQTSIGSDPAFAATTRTDAGEASTGQGRLAQPGPDLGNPRAVTRIGWPASCVRSVRNTREAIMRPAKIAVAGATGRLGRHVVEVLGVGGHEVVPIARSAGVDVITGDGLADAVAGADAIIDVTAGPSSEQRAATEFFTTAARNLQQTGERA